jgi:hypothetical protein
METPARADSLIVKKPISRGELIGTVAAIALAGALGLALAWQGWRWRMPYMKDWAVDVAAARAFAAHGTIPDRGNVTTYLSYAPPGAAWLFVPGVAMFRDLRLTYLPASALLQFGALAGIFFLARRYFGHRVATLAAVAYALSLPALDLAGGPSPRGQPLFFVAMIYCICRWVDEKDARFLAAALLIWAAGMYVFLTLAPAIFVVPAVWLLWRPPVRLRPLVFAGILILLIWFPYLRFEAGRSFADVRSQVLRHPLANPRADPKAWCDPSLMPAPRSAAGGEVRPGLWQILTARLGAIGSGLASNFLGAVPGTSLLLFLGTLAGLWLCLRAWLPPPSPRGSTAWTLAVTFLFAAFVVLRFHQSPRSIAFLRRLIGSDLSGHLSALPRYVLVGSEWLIVAGAILALLFVFWPTRGQVGTIFKSLAARFHPQRDPRPLAISLLVPWIILLCIEEPVRVDRLLWLGALQLIFLAAIVVTAAEGRRILRWACPAAMVVLVAANPIALERIKSWGQTGWSGEDAPEVQAADFLANRIHAAGKDSTRIGYSMPLIAAGPQSDVTDADITNIDLFLTWSGITNSDHCAEGQSPDDEYRVVDTTNPGPYFNVPSSGRLILLQRFGNLGVFERE